MTTASTKAGTKKIVTTTIATKKLNQFRRGTFFEKVPRFLFEADFYLEVCGFSSGRPFGQLNFQEYPRRRDEIIAERAQVDHWGAGILRN
jgi:hypothetical protein